MAEHPEQATDMLLVGPRMSISLLILFLGRESDPKNSQWMVPNDAPKPFREWLQSWEEKPNRIVLTILHCWIWLSITSWKSSGRYTDPKALPTGPIVICFQHCWHCCIYERERECLQNHLCFIQVTDIFTMGNLDNSQDTSWCSRDRFLQDFYTRQGHFFWD